MVVWGLFGKTVISLSVVMGFNHTMNRVKSNVILFSYDAR